MKRVYANCNLFDGLEDSPIVNGASIFVEDDKIVKIATDVTNFEDYEVVDLKGKYVTPGLINAHVHLFGTGKPSKVLGGGSLQKLVVKFTKTKLGHKIVDALAAGSAKNQLMSGTTTIRTVGDFAYSDVRVRDKVKSGKLVGPRMLVSGPAITVSGGHGDGTFAMTADTEEGLAECVRKNKDEGVDLIKICATGGVMDAKKKGEPGELKMTVSQIKAVTDEAHKYGLKVASHTESPQGVRATIEGHVDTIEHGSPIDAEEAEMMRAYGGVLVPTCSPALPLAKLSPELTLLNPMCVYNSNVVFKNVVQGAKDSLKYGLNLGCGTDSSCPFVSQYDMWREVWYFNKYVGVTPKKAISIATINNAKVLGVEKETGSIEVGKSADMIIMDKNPIEDLTELSRIKGVVCRGVYYDNPVIKRNKFIDDTLNELFKNL